MPRGLRPFIDVTMRLAEQSEKSRLTGTTDDRKWRGYFLSTSNFSLNEMAVKGGREIDDADRGRLVDIPLPKEAHGIYRGPPRLFERERIENHLKSKMPGITMEFRSVNFFQSWWPQLRTRQSGCVKERLERSCGIEYLSEFEGRAEDVKPLNRASERFATVYAAGALAIKLGVLEELDWDRNALRKAILSCQLDGLKEITGTKEGNDCPGSE